MLARKLSALAAGCAMVLAAGTGTYGQAPAGPNTLWRFLGIPQGINKIRDATFNRRGNLPALERKPPLKAIADPANLESTDPAIKAAAQAKQDEDLAKQKIKAIKYLAKLGCGSYDKRYKVGPKKALMAALDDCTEKVRYEAAKAIRNAAENRCELCGGTCCCDEEMVDKLFDVAYGRSEDGCCWKEPSERVREMAKEALMACCAAHPDRGGVTVETTEGEVTPTPIEGEVTPTPQNGEATPDNPPPQPNGSSAYFLRRPRGLGKAAQASKPSSRSEHDVQLLPTSVPEEGAPLPTRPAASAKKPRQARHLERGPDFQQVSHNQPRAKSRERSTAPAELPEAPVGLIEGKVADIVHDRGYVVLDLADGKTLPTGTCVKLNHRFAFTTKCLGELEVISASGGKILARPVGSLSLATITRGDEVVYYLDPNDA